MARCASDFVEDRSAEFTNDFLNEFSKLNERWHNLLTVDNLAFAERHFEGEVNISLNLSARCGEGAIDHRAVLQGKLPISGTQVGLKSGHRLEHLLTCVAREFDARPLLV